MLAKAVFLIFRIRYAATSFFVVVQLRMLSPALPRYVLYLFFKVSVIIYCDLQLKGSVLCLVGILVLTPDTLLLR